MHEDENDRSTIPELRLRGRLAAVYYPALLALSHRALAHRLGERATVYDPLVGAAAGLSAIAATLEELARRFADAKVSYEPAHAIVGASRDVTEGTLSLDALDGKGAARVSLPVACVMHRRKERQADLRTYHATVPLGRAQAHRTARAPEEGYVLPTDVAEHLAALRLGDADALVASFESGGHLRDGAGRIHRREHDELHHFYVRTLQSERGANDWVPVVIATAEDGRLCAVEYRTEKLRDGETSPKEGLLVFERGDSGLFHSVRVYDELGL
ncbi:hypothetical protein LVJ94_12625 [Pendulispora rubella]|uniref:SnoaL-like domain-containing protein n=1 Tax=Pendulispora rubella TaxID=2741070 RepID=A0ABZ2LAZ3_9BACT